MHSKERKRYSKFQHYFEMDDLLGLQQYITARCAHTKVSYQSSLFHHTSAYVTYCIQPDEGVELTRYLHMLVGVLKANKKRELKDTMGQRGENMQLLAHSLLCVGFQTPAPFNFSSPVASFYAHPWSSLFNCLLPVHASFFIIETAMTVPWGLWFFGCSISMFGVF